MSQQKEPVRRDGFIRQVLTPPVIAASAIFIVIGAVIGFLVAPSRPGHTGGVPSPATLLPSASLSSSAPVSPSSASVPPSSLSQAIPLGAACKWAYPGRATGQFSGGSFSIACLDKNGQPLGGFSGTHSLNAWCADPSHTDGKALPNPELLNGKWACGTA